MTTQHAANDQIALTVDANIVGGLFVKGWVFNAAQFKDFDAACSKGNLVNVYEWGYGPCDDYLSAIKANAAQTAFTATVRAYPLSHTLSHAHARSIDRSMDRPSTAPPHETHTQQHSSFPLHIAGHGQARRLGDDHLGVHPPDGGQRGPGPLRGL